MYFPQTTNDLQSCTGPGGSPLCADPLSTIGSCLLALGGWVASCAEQSPQCNKGAVYEIPPEEESTWQPQLAQATWSAGPTRRSTNGPRSGPQPRPEGCGWRYV